MKCEFHNKKLQLQQKQTLSGHFKRLKFKEYTIVFIVRYNVIK